MTENSNPPTTTPENDDDYIPGVTPWVKPDEKTLEKELGHKPLSNTEFDKVKAQAAETKDERWSGLEPNKSTEEFDRDLAVEQDELRKFENDYDDPPTKNDDREPATPPLAFTWSFEDIGNFFKRMIGKK